MGKQIYHDPSVKNCAHLQQTFFPGEELCTYILNCLMDSKHSVILSFYLAFIYSFHYGVVLVLFFILFILSFNDIMLTSRNYLEFF